MAQKLLYVSYVGLMRFDQTDGKECRIARHNKARPAPCGKAV